MTLSSKLVAQKYFSGIQVDFYANNVAELHICNVVYLLVIPADNGNYCYVGQAGYGVYKRARGHCNDAFKNKDNSKKANALKKYRHVQVYILKVCANETEMDAQERKYIQAFSKNTNYTRCLNTVLCIAPNINSPICVTDEKYKIEQYDLDGNWVCTFSSIRDAHRKTGIYRNGISNVINKKHKTAGGYQWKRATDPFTVEATKAHCAQIRKINLLNKTVVTTEQRKQNGQKRGLKIEQYDLTGKFIATYPSLHEAARVTKVNIKGISLCCKGVYRQCNGFQFKIANTDKKIFPNLPSSKEVLANFNVSTKGKPVGGFDEQGNLIEQYASKRQAEKSHNAYGLLNNICNNTKRFGLYWRFL